MVVHKYSTSRTTMCAVRWWRNGGGADDDDDDDMHLFARHNITTRDSPHIYSPAVARVAMVQGSRRAYTVRVCDGVVCDIICADDARAVHIMCCSRWMDVGARTSVLCLCVLFEEEWGALVCHVRIWTHSASAGATRLCASICGNV